MSELCPTVLGERGDPVPGVLYGEAPEPGPGHPQLPALPLRQVRAKEAHAIPHRAGRCRCRGNGVLILKNIYTSTGGVPNLGQCLKLGHL